MKSPIDAFKTIATFLAGANEAMEQGAASLTEDIAAMDARERQINAKEAKWLVLEQQIQTNSATASDVVALDVGGTLFKVPKEILLSMEGSYFHCLLGSGHWKPDTANDAYFLDLDPTTFPRVMEFLRTGTLHMDGLSKSQQGQLHRSMEYLQLINKADAVPTNLPTNELTWNTDMGSEHVIISRNKKELSMDPLKVVFGDMPVTEFRVQVNALDGGTMLASACLRWSRCFAPREATTFV
ncbi:Aste57867_3012 [Aphanomyces stellatus]|uniref:Aste57867_3012 protein n=1 Tax=Aphanomyces stellatus TaxID=120398 RepID=A0A485K8U6_9STRA|nr:hypothetical protein As57867_003003 [Aphanomyces stellatus]VFT80192.1 Aste57867_3012 [Aphanomyces stellatus]